MDLAHLSQLVSDHGIAVLAPLAVIEGPMVTIIAAYLASLGLLNIWQVFVCVVLADLVGDAILYAIGRFAFARIPLNVRLRFGASPARMEALRQAFADKGVRLLLIGKLTHAAGFAVLLAAGVSRMAFVPFLLANLVATVPKSLALIAVGYLFGGAHVLIAKWLPFGSALVFVALAALALGYYVYRRRAAP